jgi:hypothetical protein
MSGNPPGQEPQVLQPVELQPPQPPLAPATEDTMPDSSLENEAQAETTRSPAFWQRGQGAASSAWLKERNNSNFASQSEQTYSYIGIILPLPVILNLFRRQIKFGRLSAGTVQRGNPPLLMLQYRGKGRDNNLSLP